MPLRDHFHAPLRGQHHWEGFHSAWANTMVRHLNTRWLPARYRAEPQVRLGAQVEIDAATFEQDTAAVLEGEKGNGVATTVWAPPRPTQTFTVAFPDEDVYEVRVYDDERGFRLVAAVELVSPRNKDRPAARLAFAGKCAGYLRQGVSVVVVDVVTERHDSLHDELMRLLEPADPKEWLAVAPLYAVAYRPRAEDERWRLDTWPESLATGAALPTLPLWLAADLAAPLELEASYEETCQVLRLG
jgi:hypothetical protein